MPPGPTRLDEVVREEGHASAAEADVHAPPVQRLQPLQHCRRLRMHLATSDLPACARASHDCRIS